jgi:hypothetical protein
MNENVLKTKIKGSKFDPPYKGVGSWQYMMLIANCKLLTAKTFIIPVRLTGIDPKS